MSINDLISALRDRVEVEGPGSLAWLLDEAADALEELIERDSIKEEGRR